MRALLIAAILAGAAPPARADDPTAPMEEYFAGEKRGGLWLVGMGAAGIGSGVYLASRDTDRATGASYSTIGLGALHLAAGAYVYLASNRRIDKNHAQIAGDPGAFVREERDRIRGVETQFLVLKIVEGVLIAGGVGLAIYGEREDEPKLTGAGIGLAIEAGATLLFDIVAARRARRYRESLDSLRVNIDGDGVTAGFALSF